MSTIIDSKVVEMRFDNKQFEEGTKQSLSTLERLKQALNFSQSYKSLEGLNDAAGKVSLNGIAAGVQALEDRFSVLGIVGMRVIENLTDSMMNTLGKAINFVTDSIVSGGIRRAMNIENAHFQLQALLNDEELVQKIMDQANDSVTGTAYAYDEAAKAASMFAASGIEAGDQMETALRGLVGVAAMTNSEYEGVSRIFTTIAGNGRVLGDQLLQLSSRGLNAAATIADFFNKVNDGTADATDDVRQRIQSLSHGLKVSEGDIREWVSDSAISFNIFAQAMDDAFGEAAFRANETFTGAFSNMKAALARIGAGFISPLVAQNSEVVLLFNALKDRINDVKKALVFDESLGNVEALSKQVTDSILMIAGAATEYINNADLSKSMSLFYYWVEITKHSLVGLGSILKPIGEAFYDTFLSGSVDELLRWSGGLEEFTSHLKLSEENSKELRDAFKGLFDIVDLLVDTFVLYLSALMPIEEPTSDLVTLVSQLAGSMGRALTNFSTWARSSPFFIRVFRSFSSAIQLSMSLLSMFIRNVIDLKNRFFEMPIVINIIKKLNEGFTILGNKAAPYIDIVNQKLAALKQELMRLIPIEFENLMEWFVEKIEELNVKIENLDFSNIDFSLDGLISKFKELLKLFVGSDGSTFSERLKALFETFMSSEFVQNIKDNIQSFIDSGTSLIEWLSNTFGPALDINIGDIIRIVTNLLVFGKLLQAIRLFREVVKIGQAIPMFLDSLRGVLRAVQNSINAAAILQISIAIAVLAGAVIALAGQKAGDLLKATFVLAALGGLVVVLGALTKIVGGIRAINTVGIISLIFIIASMVGAIYALTKMISSDPDSFDKAEKQLGLIMVMVIGMVGAMTVMGQYLGKGMTTFAQVSLGIISIAAALYIVIKSVEKLFSMKIPKDYKVKMDILTELFVELVGILLALAIISRIADDGTIKATTLLSTAAMLYIIILSLEKLFKIEIPNDWLLKVGLLEFLFLNIQGLILALALCSALAGGNSIKATSLIAIGALLYIVVLSLEKLFNIELPNDFIVKLGILQLIFLDLYVLIGILGAASGMGKKNIGLMGSLIGVAALLVAVVITISVLTYFPLGGIIKGLIVLGAVMSILALTLNSVAKVTNPDAYKSILAMAVMVVTITFSLIILATIDLTKLLVGAGVLGAVLLTLALDFYTISKVSDKVSEKSIVSMIAALSIIVGGLYLISGRDWEKIAASGAALSLTLLTFAEAFKIIQGVDKVDNDKVTSFLWMSLSALTIGYALIEMAKQPWDRLAAAGVSLSLTVMAFAKAFEIIQNVKEVDNNKVTSFLWMSLAGVTIGFSLAALAYYAENETMLLASAAALSATVIAFTAAFKILETAGKTDWQAIAQFALIVVATIPIAMELIILASQPWEGLLAGALALSSVVLVIAGAMAIMSSFTPKPEAIFLFLSACLGVIGIGLVLMSLSEQPWDGLLASAVSLSIVLLTMTTVLALCSVIGALGAEALIGIGILDIFILDLLGILVLLGWIISHETVQDLLAGGEGVLGRLGAALGDFIGSIISGIVGGVASTLPIVGEALTEFANEADNFIKWCRLIDEDALNGALRLVAILLAMFAAEILSIFIPQNFSDIGDELVELGPKIRQFARSVSGIDSSALDGAKTAVEIIVELIKGLPFDSDSFLGMLAGRISLSEFAEDLTNFGPALAEFAETVKGVRKSHVQGAVNAGSIIAGLANELPYDSDSFMGMLMGTISLSEFGKDLKDFGPDLVDFAETVKKVDEDSVKGAQLAGSAMASLAKELPYDSDSFMGMLMGTISLSEFGKDLKDFGPDIVEFAKTVQGINANAANNAAKVGQTMAALANNLPTDPDSWIGKLQGISSFKDYGKDLKAFGPDIADFASSVEGITEEQAMASGNVATIMSNIASIELPDANEWWIFGENNDLTVFGNNLANFGESLKSYDTSLSGIDMSRLKQGVTVYEDLIHASVDLNSVDPSLVSTFGYNLELMGQAGFEGFVATFNGADEFILETVTNMLDKFVVDIGLQMYKFDDKGVAIAEALKSGLSSEYDNLLETGKNLIRKVLRGIQDLYLYPTRETSSMYVAGGNAAQGFIDGLKSKLEDAAKAGAELARAAKDALDKELRIASPSKEFESSGDFSGIGFVKGLLKNISNVQNASEEIGNTAIDSLREAFKTISDEFNMTLNDDPTIRPTVDLSNIRRSVDDINALFNQAIFATALNADATASTMRSGKNTNITDDETAQNGSGNQTFNFIQNNNSPKALSRIDIYRQTRNQFAQFKEEVGRA